MTHAMVFTGVHLDNDGKIVKFKVENAWGTAIGHQGWFMMTSAWFDQYVTIALLLCTHLLQIDTCTK